jgi:hypothetical protein
MTPYTEITRTDARRNSVRPHKILHMKTILLVPRNAWWCTENQECARGMMCVVVRIAAKGLLAEQHGLQQSDAWVITTLCALLVANHKGQSTWGLVGRDWPTSLTRLAALTSASRRRYPRTRAGGWFYGSWQCKFVACAVSDESC